MKPLITIQNIDKAYGAQPLFENISFSITENNRLGIIGPNGAGKSSLLKILAGLEPPDHGKVVRNLNMQLVYLAQSDAFSAESALKEALFSTAASELSDEECQYRLWEATQDYIFPDLTRSVGSLSGGYRKRLAIIHALLQKPDLLLLDEPTNHLDLEGILWLEKLLKNARFSIVLVSHDRYFLNKCANNVMELNKVFPDGYFKNTGDYNEFLEKRKAFIQTQLEKEQSLSNKMRREAEWLSRMPKARTTKAQYRIDQAAQLQNDLQKIKNSNAQIKSVNIEFDSTLRKTKKLLELKNISIIRGEKLLFEKVNLILSPGICIGLMGKNGSGKSTLMQIIQEKLTPYTGEVIHADNVRIIHFDQNRAQLDQQQTLLRALAPDGDSVYFQGETIHVAAWAKKFLFSREQLTQPISSLSGGEQARVLIANLMRQPADILLLDEPTNDLDIPTLEVLEESLCEFPGAIILITHDRYLLDRVSDRLLYLDGTGNASFFADYAQWQTSVSATTTPKNVVPAKTDKISKPTTGLNYEQRKELERLPNKISNAEAKLATLEATLQDPQLNNNLEKLNAALEKIQIERDKINALYVRWEELEKG